MSNLPQQKVSSTSDKGVNTFFDRYYTKSVSFPSNEIDAVIAFFEKRGFDKTASITVGTTLLQQAKIDNVNIFKLIDTLTNLDPVQLSAVVTEILNYNRARISTLGYKRPQASDKFERRNIIDAEKNTETYIFTGYVEPGYVR